MKNILRRMVLSSAGENIGEVKDIYFDDVHWKIRYFVVNTGTWLSKKLVLVSPHSVVDLGSDGFEIRTKLSRSQLENSPSIDCARPISRVDEERYSRYFSLPFYWASTTAFLPMGHPPIHDITEVEGVDLEKKTSESHLRSYEEVFGYKIKARDDEFGNIEDLFFELESFSIRFLLINTISFWPSKSVLISPEWISEISWHEKVFVTELEKEVIKSAPAYKSEKNVERTYEQKLFDHYAVSPYWSLELGNDEKDNKVEGWIPGIQEEIARNKNLGSKGMNH